MSFITELAKTMAERHEYLYELLIQHILLSLVAIAIITQNPANDWVKYFIET